MTGRRESGTRDEREKGKHLNVRQYRQREVGSGTGKIGTREKRKRLNDRQLRHGGTHVPVLLAEAVEGLALRPDATVIDATLGAGGHFLAIADRLDETGTLLGIDVDPAAIAAMRERVQGHAEGPHLFFEEGNFRRIKDLAKAHAIMHADAILADLGWRMEQFAGSPAGGGKGFSFSADEPLLMTFGDPADYPFTAADIVNSWKEDDIANVLKGYGQERYAKRIANAIIAARGKQAIRTSAELAEIISRCVPPAYRHGRIHPATKTFQALRIAVNDELDALAECIEGALEVLAPKGRLAVITFHSLEDRIVKNLLRSAERRGANGETFRRITKKPITPSTAEIRRNPRARSAKLRIIERTNE